MTIEGAVPVKRSRPTATPYQFVTKAPRSAEHDGRDKLSAARGIAIGLGVCTAFWGAVAAIMVLVSN
jgi:L-cystine uptake protein TcyP (sodium:dicarboxylate symporter family)